MRWDGAVTFITGASRGIGRATARAVAARGSRVGLIARSKDELEEVLESCGGAGAIAPADVTDRDQTEGAVGALLQAMGAPDVLVVNAGVGAYGRFVNTSVEDLERMIRVNYLGAVYTLKAALPAMLERGSGHVVLLSSIAARIGAPLEAGYSASKFALAGLGEGLALELHGSGVGLSMVDPGPVETSFFDARGVPFQRSKPKPVSAERIADEVIAVVEKGKQETFVPRWLRFPVALKAVLPGAFRMGALRDFREDLRRH